MTHTPLRTDAYPAEDWRLIHVVADRGADSVAAALMAVFAAIVAGVLWAEVEVGFAYRDASRVLTALGLYRLNGEFARRVQPALEAVADDATTVATPLLAEQMIAADEAPGDGVLDQARGHARDRTRNLLWFPFAAYMTGQSVSILRWLIVKLALMPGNPGDKASILRAAIGLNGQQTRALVRRMEALTTDGVPWRRVVLVARRQAEAQVVTRVARVAANQSFAWATRAEVELFRAAGLSPDWSLEWLAILDAHTCEVCAELDGSRVPVQHGFHSERAAREADYDFNGSVGLPPIHDNCRCRVILLHKGAFVRQVAPEVA